MDDPGLVGRRQALRRLRHQLQPQLHRHAPDPALCRAPRSQIPARHVLLFQVERRPIEIHAQQLHQVRMVARPRPPHAEQRHLPLQGPHAVCAHAELEDARRLQPPVAAQPDFAKAARAQLLLQHPRGPGHLEAGRGAPPPRCACARGARCRRGIRHGPEEAVAVLGQRFDEARLRSGIAERLAQPSDDGVQVVLEIDEDVLGPEPALEILARDHLAGVFDQQHQHLERLVAQPDAQAPFEEPASLHVDVEAVEADVPGHRWSPRMASDDTLRPAATSVQAPTTQTVLAWSVR